MSFAAQLIGVSPLLSTGLLTTPTFVQEDEVGQTSQEDMGRVRSQDYRPAPQVASIPGAPIEVQFTEYGIVLRSDDLDALDDIERLIQEQLDAESAVQLPTFFFLKYRKADSMKAQLEQHFGIDSGGGGDGRWCGIDGKCHE